MNHASRFIPAAALAGALFAMTACAWSQDIPSRDVAGTNAFRAERRATNGVRIPRDAHAGRYAAPATRGPFETNDTRELRMSGGRLVPRTPGKHADVSHWPANRVTPGADGLGRRVPEHERRALNWDAYLKEQRHAVRCRLVRDADVLAVEPARTGASVRPRARPARRAESVRPVGAAARDTRVLRQRRRHALHRDGWCGDVAVVVRSPLVTARAAGDRNAFTPD